MKHSLFRNLLAIALLAVHLCATAEDIDLFVGLPTSTSSEADLPNVLIIIDNTANWNTTFSAEMTALAAVVGGLTPGKVRLGLMFFKNLDDNGAVNDGAYVRSAIRTLDSDTKTKFVKLVNSFTVGGDKASGGKAGLAMEEAYRYLSGQAPNYGNNKDKTDYSGNVSGTAASNAIYALPGNALSSKTGSPYNSPILSGGCAKTFIIYLSNGSAQDNNADSNRTDGVRTAYEQASFGAALSPNPIPISPSLPTDNKMDEWSRFMKKSNLGVTTYTIEAAKGSAQPGGWTALMKSVAGVSDGKYFDVSANPSSANVQAVFDKIFSEIQDVNSVFASVSLPVSVGPTGNFLNNVYIGQFRPDKDGFPRWVGNLKQYRLGFSGTDLKLLDADGSDAINSGTGFIAPCARSYWTATDTPNTYWAFKPQGTCTIAGSDVANSPDGNIVEKGAQGQKLRGTNPASRSVKTCSPTFASCTTLTSFDTTNGAITNASLGAATTAEHDDLINWARGTDLSDEDIDANTTEMRPSVHGDVVHSRPVLLNYNTDAAPEVVAFYGGNDGVLRAVNANRDGGRRIGDQVTGPTPGMEFWGFVAPEYYTNIKRIRNNTPVIKYFGSTVSGAQPKPYGIDGPISTFQGTISGAAKKFIYTTMRRGGRVLYAFDVTTPTAIALKWKKGCPNNFPATGTVDDTGCTTDFSGIGQTWSSAKILKAEGYGSGASPVIIMGGGYDTCEDADQNTCTSSSKGNKIYLLDANTGALLQTFDTDRSVIGDVVVVPDATTGYAKYVYAADLGGNIYRISGATANLPIGTTAPASTGGWSITKIAALGCAEGATSTTTCANNRKFMFAPDVVDEQNGVYSLMIGSGDREKPLAGYTSTYAVSNYFFMLKDKPEDSSWLSSESARCGANLICRESLTPVLTSGNPTATDLAGKKGWYLGLAAHEQVVTSAITVFDTITFSTHIPQTYVAGVCTPSLGTATTYSVSRVNAESVDGSTRGQTVTGGGLSPSPVAGQVQLDDGRVVPVLFGGNPRSPFEPEVPAATTTVFQPKSRVYWYIQK